jgi:hypothetical protein
MTKPVPGAHKEKERSIVMRNDKAAIGMSAGRGLAANKDVPSVITRNGPFDMATSKKVAPPMREHRRHLITTIASK